MVVFTEVVAQEEGHSYTVQTYATGWEHTETWRFLEAPEGGTTVLLAGRHLRPAIGSGASGVQAALDQMAEGALERLATRAGDHPGAL